MYLGEGEGIIRSLRTPRVFWSVSKTKEKFVNLEDGGDYEEASLFVSYPRVC